MRIKFDDKVFVYRVAGIASRGDRILIHRAESDNFWALPGGACEFNEDSRSALKREMKEELNADVEVGRLLWVVENFFEHDEKPWHEIGLYYQISFVGNLAALYEQEQFHGVESFYEDTKDVRLTFKWLSMAELDRVDLRPTFLKDGLSNLPAQTEVIVNRG